MKEHYKHIIWDWNGTLLADVEACVNAVNRMIVRRRMDKLEISRYREIFSFPVTAYYRVLGFNLEAEDWDAMAREFHDSYLVDETIRLHEGAYDVLQALHEWGTPMSILSACEQGILTRMVREFALAPFFEQIRGRDDLYAHSKVELGRELIDELEAQPADMLLVGDTLHDRDVARELGCDCVLVSNGHQSHARLAASDVPVLRSLDDILKLLKLHPR